MIKSILTALILLGLLLVGFYYWENYKFTHPTEESVKEEFAAFTNYNLPNNAKIILAKRSIASPLLGDYNACFIIVLEEATYNDFLVRLSAIGSTPSQNVIDHWMAYSCPSNVLFDKYRQHRGFSFHSAFEPDVDELLHVWTIKEERILFIFVSVS